ncbi:MAG: hypothetical protein NC548_38415, partial [Lachnospiraceae bacterium]|nr:hypothetical protein [Lachnospiraceae bacterium]
GGGGEFVKYPQELTVGEYIKLFFKYPLDFILNYLNSFFLILSPDHGDFNLFSLLIFYTMLYCFLYIGFLKCKFWKNFFTPLFMIGFSFLWATVPMMVLNIEARYCMQIQGLIIALVLCDGTIWENITATVKNIRENGLRVTLKAMNKISWPVVLYVLFLCICIMHIATLYETLGTDIQGVLINLE